MGITDLSHQSLCKCPQCRCCWRNHFTSARRTNGAGGTHWSTAINIHLAIILDTVKAGDAHVAVTRSTFTVCVERTLQSIRARGHASPPQSIDVSRPSRAPFWHDEHTPSDWYPDTQSAPLPSPTHAPSGHVARQLPPPSTQLSAISAFPLKQFAPLWKRISSSDIATHSCDSRRIAALVGSLSRIRTTGRDRNAGAYLRRSQHRFRKEI